MIRKWFGIFLLVFAAAVVLNLSGCGRDQQLVSIQVQPSSQTFGAANIPVGANAGAQVQLRALGSYIHPPVTKDITSQVTWASNTPQMMTVDSSGLLTATGDACGSALISATMTTGKSSGGLSSSGALVTGYMTGSVVCFTGTSGGGGGAASPILSLGFSGGGSGTVTSAPSGLGCSVSCSAQFATGTTVTLTATPIGSSSFGSWSNCDSGDAVNPCTVNLTANRTVTVTFN